MEKINISTRKLITHQEMQVVMDLFNRVIKEGGAFDRYSGNEVDIFEKEFADFYNRKFATAVSSGTAAIHTALASLELEPGQEVICAPITDPGAIMPVIHLNLIPVFADCIPGTFNMSAEGVKAVINENTGAIVVGHIAGEPAEIDKIVQIAQERGIPVIEDCAQAHFTRYKGKLLGTFGMIGVFSTMSGKHMTTGGQGGMIITDNEDIYWKCKQFADRGKPFGTEYNSNIRLGLNYRMTELEACIGRVQLKRLPEIVNKRRKLVSILDNELKDDKFLKIGYVLPDSEPSWWFIRIYVDSRSEVSKDTASNILEKYNIPSAPTYTTLIYEQIWFKERRTFGKSGLPWSLVNKEYIYENCCPNAEKAQQEHFLIYFHEDMREEEIKYIGDIIRKIDKGEEE